MSIDGRTWMDAFRLSPMGKVALQKLRELDEGDVNEFSRLEEMLLKACFHAYRLSTTPDGDSYEKLYQEGKRFHDSADDLLKCVQRLTRAADAQPLHIGTSLRGVRGKLCLTPEERLNGPYALAAALSEVLQGFAAGILSLKEDNPFRAGSVAGCLDYAEDIRSKRSSDVALNGLVFELALIFRSWNVSIKSTNSERFGLLEIPCTMPRHGRPCFPMISAFIEATLFEAVGSSARTDSEALADRLKKLLQAYPSLQYVGWSD